MKTNDKEEKLFDAQHTADEPMTGAQHFYLETLSAEADEKVDEALTKAEASQRIDNCSIRPAADWRMRVKKNSPANIDRAPKK